MKDINNYKVISYQDRRQKIKTVKDITKQLKLAKAYASKLKSMAKKQDTLKDKVAVAAFAKEADKVVWQLRRNVFDIEDEINAVC